MNPLIVFLRAMPSLRVMLWLGLLRSFGWDIMSWLWRRKFTP